MQDVMSLPDKEKTVLEGYKDILKALKSDQGFKLEAANRIYVQENFKLLASYLEKTRKFYQAEAVNINFAKNAEVRLEVCFFYRRCYPKINMVFEVG